MLSHNNCCFFLLRLSAYVCFTRRLINPSTLGFIIKATFNPKFANMLPLYRHFKPSLMKQLTNYSGAKHEHIMRWKCKWDYLLKPVVCAVSRFCTKSAQKCMLFLASAAAGSKSDATSSSTHNLFSARLIFSQTSCCISGMNGSVNTTGGRHIFIGQWSSEVSNWRHIGDVEAEMGERVWGAVN